VARRRDEDAVGDHDRLEDDRGDLVRALGLDGVPQVGERPLGLLLRCRGGELAAVEVGAPVVHDARDAGLRTPPSRLPGQGDGPGRGAVVAAVGREDLVPAGVRAGRPQRVLVGLRSPVGEEDLVHPLGGELAHHPRRLGPRLLGEGGRHRRDPPGRLLDRRHEAWVLVADVDVDQLAGQVEETTALVVPEVGTLPAGERQRVHGTLGRPGRQDVAPGELADVRLAPGVCDSRHRRTLLGTHGGAPGTGAGRMGPRWTQRSTPPTPTSPTRSARPPRPCWRRRSATTWTPPRTGMRSAPPWSSASPDGAGRMPSWSPTSTASPGPCWPRASAPVTGSASGPPTTPSGPSCSSRPRRSARSW